MIRAGQSEPRTLEEWAASPWRPCCGTCRRPMLVRTVYIDSEPAPGELPLSCSNCGDAWDGSEASKPEAQYRLGQAQAGL